MAARERPHQSDERRQSESRSGEPVLAFGGDLSGSTKASGKSRILVIGDSFVWGDGYVNANDIWWRQLERELHRRGYWDVEVVAAGFLGASTQDQLTWLRAGGLARLGSPDLVILGYVTNDPDIRDATGASMVLQIGRDIPLRQWRVLDRSIGRVTPNLAGQLKQRLTAKWQAGVRDAYPYGEWELKLLEPPNIDAYRDVVGELGAFLRGTGIPYFVVTLPNYPDPRSLRRALCPGSNDLSVRRLAFHRSARRLSSRVSPGGEVLHAASTRQMATPAPKHTLLRSQNGGYPGKGTSESPRAQVTAAGGASAKDQRLDTPGCRYPRRP